MDRWVNQIAIVTGASAGIGASIAEKLVEEGLQVVGFARRLERLEELSKTFQNKKGKFYAVKVDITSEDDILKGFKWVKDNVGPVSILVNNAGVTQVNNLIDGDTEKWKKIFDTNILGLCIATREAVKVMRDSKIDGHVIHINSVLGHVVGNRPGAYPASKFAVTALTETLRQEFNRLGSKIKITSVSPGITATEFAAAAGYKLDPDVVKKIPKLEAEDVADAVLYTLSTPPHVQVHEMILKPIGQDI